MPDSESVSSSLTLLGDLEDGAITSINAEIDGEMESIILRRRGASVQAWLNICPHAGRRLDYAPGRFLLSDGLLVCAAHGASFELEEGECVGGPCRGASLRAVPVRIGAEGALHFGSAQGAASGD
ncbi:Rieske (2Fe-2S) protein [Arenimonas sp.]|uniref:Rieske (2Fe-2S) protein n=1 Tax=Arenimonas sp. TaxID=1872635 RepID=UPI0039E43089